MEDVKWRVTCKRFVGFLDIMGFKDRVMRDSHKKVYDLMKKISNYANFNSNIEWNPANKNLIRTTLYSDSIIIYSKDEEPDSLHAIVCTISGLTEDLLKEGIPFKGALSFGNMSVDMKNSIFFGQPLIDAYLLQEEVNFYGTIIHGSAQQIIEEYNRVSFIHEYNCLLKKGRNKHLTIGPMSFFIENDEVADSDNEEILNSIHQIRFTASGYIRNYIDETEKYLESIQNNNKKSQKK
ncbi:MAG: hypothetical protein F9K37_10525 [Bacteroidales bacterium]|nr:MAG: hypothetical protein F9K37_10525 [Bacteroidales bacterium]